MVIVEVGQNAKINVCGIPGIILAYHIYSIKRRGVQTARGAGDGIYLRAAFIKLSYETI